MTPSLDVLLDTVKAMGIRFFIDSGTLRFHAPRGALTDALRQQLREHKVALMERLSGWEFIARELEREGTQLMDFDAWHALMSQH